MDYDKLQSQNQVSGIPPEFFEAEMIDSLWSTFDGHSKIYEDQLITEVTRKAHKHTRNISKITRR